MNNNDDQPQATPRPKWLFLPNLNRIEFLLRGAICIYYFNQLIALVDEKGIVRWRDQRYPLFLVEYLLSVPTPEDVKRN